MHQCKVNKKHIDEDTVEKKSIPSKCLFTMYMYTYPCILSWKQQAIYIVYSEQNISNNYNLTNHTVTQVTIY